ncbi:MAG: hypothetical protein HY553_03110 [Elusimicrobia bacterium]|nr:hypothetical protein [Elusimicrobiota bacterium]
MRTGAARGAALVAIAALFAGAGAQVPPVPEPVDAPLFSRELWGELPPLDPLLASWLRARYPGTQTAMVRRLEFDRGDAVMAQAVARGYAGSDLFSDSGLRGPWLYFIYGDDVRRLFDHYELRVVTLPSGQTDDGEPYEMQGLLLGGGKVVAIYSLSEFEFHNPYFPSHKFRFRDPVVYTIRGRADLGIDGAWVKWKILWPKMDRFVKVSPTEVRVETSLGSTTDPLRPIRRKS